jgi:hypothetical protein
MNYILATVISFVFLFSVCFAGEELELKDQKDKESYGLGYQHGQDLKTQGMDVNPGVYISGIQDAVGGKEPLMSPEEIRATIQVYSQQKLDTPQKPAEQQPPKGQRPWLYQQRYVKVIADLSVSPLTHAGPCPALFTFKGKIHVNKPTTVQYRFVRSDNSRSLPVYLAFEKPGMKEVTDTWQLGDAKGLPTFSGWEALQIIWPMKADSNRVYFKGSCTDPGPPLTSGSSEEQKGQQTKPAPQHIFIQPDPVPKGPAPVK